MHARHLVSMLFFGNRKHVSADMGCSRLRSCFHAVSEGVSSPFPVSGSGNRGNNLLLLPRRMRVAKILRINRLDQFNEPSNVFLSCVRKQGKELIKGELSLCGRGAYLL